MAWSRGALAIHSHAILGKKICRALGAEPWIESHYDAGIAWLRSELRKLVHGGGDIGFVYVDLVVHSKHRLRLGERGHSDASHIPSRYDGCEHRLKTPVRDELESHGVAVVSEPLLEHSGKSDVSRIVV